MRDIYLIAHDMRSTYNVGSLMRTAEGLAVKKLYLTGYTPHPYFEGDNRLPHIYNKLTKDINKTALGAQDSIDWEYNQDLSDVIDNLKLNGIPVVALEQTNKSINIIEFKAGNNIAILLGTEVTGLTKEILDQTDFQIEIPMYGKKESFNVVQAAAMALFQFRFY